MSDSFPYWFLSVLLFVAGDCVAQQQQQPNSSARHDYIDDDDQRPLADLKFEVASQNPQAIQVNIAAHGPHVETIGGYRGIAGFNRYTAEELDLILLGRHITAVTTSVLGEKIAEGRIASGEVGTLPERRLRRDGTVDYLHRSSELPLNIKVLPMASTTNEASTVVTVDGQPRLRFRYQLAKGQIASLTVESLGHDGYIVQDDLNLVDRWKFATFDETPPPVKVSDWEDRDAEGRWVLMLEELDEEPESIDQWVAWLTDQKEFSLLEQLAIYHMDAFKSHGVGVALAKAGAPQWIRVAAWHENSPPVVGHGRQMARQLLSDHDKETVLHWLTTHRDHLDNWKPGLDSIYRLLKGANLEPQDSSDYLPPLKISSIFGPLDAPQKVPVFGDRKKAEPGVTYEHQVVRAIRALAISGRQLPKVRAKIRALMDHDNQRIQIEALLAHSFLLRDDDSSRKPVRMLQIVDDESEPEEVRDAALLAVSYQDHPAILLKLHDIARDPQHAAWKAAASRLGDIGWPFSAGILENLKQDQLTDEQQKIRNQSLAVLKKRKFSPDSWTLAQTIRISAVATSRQHPDAEVIREWVVDAGSKLRDEARKKLRKHYSYERLNDFRPIWYPTDMQRLKNTYEKLFSLIVTEE